MSDNNQLVYEGNPLLVHLPSGKLKECIPYIYRNHCGDVSFGIMDGANETAVLVSSPRPILAFRMIEALRLVKKIDDTIAVYAICLTVGEVINQFESEEVIKKNYLKIMEVPIPREIIKSIIKEGDLYEIAELDLEVSQGNISWQPEFAELGIENPAEAEKRLKEEASVVEYLGDLLKDYKETLQITDEVLASLIEAECIQIAKLSRIPDAAIVAAAGVAAFFRKEASCNLFSPGFSGALAVMNQEYFLQKSVNWLKKKTGWSFEDCILTITKTALDLS